MLFTLTNKQSTIKTKNWSSAFLSLVKNKTLFVVVRDILFIYLFFGFVYLFKFKFFFFFNFKKVWS